MQHYGLQEEGCLAPLLSEAERSCSGTEQVVDIINLSSLPWSQHILVDDMSFLVQVKDALGKAVPGQQRTNDERPWKIMALNNSNGRVSLIFMSFAGNHLGQFIQFSTIASSYYTRFIKFSELFPWPRSANVIFA